MKDMKSFDSRQMVFYVKSLVGKNKSKDPDMMPSFANENTDGEV